MGRTLGNLVVSEPKRWKAEGAETPVARRGFVRPVRPTETPAFPVSQRCLDARHHDGDSRAHVPEGPDLPVVGHRSAEVLGALSRLLAVTVATSYSPIAFLRVWCPASPQSAIRTSFDEKWRNVLSWDMGVPLVPCLCFGRIDRLWEHLAPA